MRQRIYHMEEVNQLTKKMLPNVWTRLKSHLYYVVKYSTVATWYFTCFNWPSEIGDQSPLCSFRCPSLRCVVVITESESPAWGITDKIIHFIFPTSPMELAVLIHVWSPSTLNVSLVGYWHKMAACYLMGCVTKTMLCLYSSICSGYLLVSSHIVACLILPQVLCG